MTIEETTRLDRLRRYSYWLDEGIPVPGTRFRVGLDALFGLFPGIGDVIGAILAITIVGEAVRRRAPPLVLLRMLLNIAVDTGLGSIPIAGDIFDAVWKANRRNVALLERHLGEHATAQPVNRFVVTVAVVALLLLCLAIAAAGVIFLTRLFGATAS